MFAGARPGRGLLARGMLEIRRVVVVGVMSRLRFYWEIGLGSAPLIFRVVILGGEFDSCRQFIINFCHCVQWCSCDLLRDVCR